MDPTSREHGQPVVLTKTIERRVSLFNLANCLPPRMTHFPLLFPSYTIFSFPFFYFSYILITLLLAHLRERNTMPRMVAKYLLSFPSCCGRSSDERTATPTDSWTGINIPAKLLSNLCFSHDEQIWATGRSTCWALSWKSVTQRGNSLWAMSKISDFCLAADNHSQ